MKETVARINGMITTAKKELKLPQSLPFDSVVSVDNFCIKYF